MLKILSAVHDFLWGIPALVLLSGTGLYLTCVCCFPQVVLLPRAVYRLFREGNKNRSGGVTPFQALCTALAGTVGTGNLIGVAGAICLGGPGAVFWMWICGIIGMATKYAEAVLANKYRVMRNGEFLGGTMYIISEGISSKGKWLGILYSIFGMLAAFGVGSAVQVNAVVNSFHSISRSREFANPVLTDFILGGIIAISFYIIMRGGTKRIAHAAEILVPAASAAYILVCIVVLIIQAPQIPTAFRSIVTGAFHPKSVTGGLIGSSFQAMRVGCARGIFSNEAGMGTASIAHASATADHPVEQGMMGLIEVFVDTILICTMTSFVILCSNTTIPYGKEYGTRLITDAFGTALGKWVSVFLTVSLGTFAVATIMGWGMYSTRFCEYLFGTSNFKLLILLQSIAIWGGAVLDTSSVWILAEIANGLMMLPNLIALIWLSPELRRLTIEYINSG